MIITARRETQVFENDTMTTDNPVHSPGGRAGRLINETAP